MRIITHITSDSIRTMCIKNNLYTKGNNEEYSKMLNMIDEIDEPNFDEIFQIASDILEHSEEQTISNIMFLILNQAALYFADFSEEE